jgi:zinc protease
MRCSYSLLGLVMLASSVQALPVIEHWKTANGARVYFAQARELPMVDVRIVFDAGSARDGDQLGLARFTNALLAEGAGSLSANDIAERLADHGAQLGTDSGRDSASVSLRTLSERHRLQSAVSLIAAVIGRPDFPEDAVERVRDQMLVALRQEQQSPAATGQRALYRLVFADHPYAQDPGGDEPSLGAVRKHDLVAFHRRYYVASNAVVAIVGDLDRAGAEGLAQRVTGELSEGQAAVPLPAVATRARAARETITFPAAQVHLLLGQVGVSYHDPDFFPLYVGNHILGGSGLVSLLSEQLREQRGLAYSVWSGFSPLRANGPFVLAMQTRHDQSEFALEVLGTTLERFVSGGPSSEQVATAKRNILGGFALRLDSNLKLLNYLALIGYHRLPLDYLERFGDDVDSVTARAIRDAFTRRIHPKAMVTLAVGPADDRPRSTRSGPPAVTVVE